MAVNSAWFPIYGFVNVAPAVTLGQALNAANTWLAFSLVGNAASKTLADVKILITNVVGTPAASDITCSLQLDAAGVPDGSTIESRPLALTPTIAYHRFTGFTTALTAGRRYWLVFKNGNASPASHYVEITTGTNQTVPTMTQVDTTTGLYGWGGRRVTTDGSSWGTEQSVVGYRVGYSDNSIEGILVNNFSVSGTTDGIYSTREAGNLITAPANVKLNVRGCTFLTSAMSGTPTGNLRAKLYEGTTLVRTSAPLVPNGNPGNAWLDFYFATPYLLTPGQQYRYVLSETAQSDANTVRFNYRFVSWCGDTDELAQIPLGARRTLFDGSQWTEPQTWNFLPSALLLELGAEYAPPASDAEIAQAVWEYGNRSLTG
jgi:hypothetical protein